MNSHRAPRGRAAETAVGFGTLLGATVLILATVALGSLIPDSVENTEHRERPFARVGNVGDERSTREFGITVTGVRGAGKIEDSKRVHDTGGVWIIVTIRVVATEEADIIGYAAVQDDKGRLFRLSQRVQQPLDGRMLQPGIPVKGEFAFEVPKDAATHLTVLFSDVSFDRRMEAQVEIRLPTVDSTAVDRWAATAEPDHLAKPAVTT